MPSTFVSDKSTVDFSGPKFNIISVCFFQHCFRHSTVTCIVQLPKFNASKLRPVLSTSVFPVVWSGSKSPVWNSWNRPDKVLFSATHSPSRTAYCKNPITKEQGLLTKRYEDTKPRSSYVFLKRGASLSDLFCCINCKNTAKPRASTWYQLVLSNSQSQCRIFNLVRRCAEPRSTTQHPRWRCPHFSPWTRQIGSVEVLPWWVSSSPRF